MNDPRARMTWATIRTRTFDAGQGRFVYGAVTPSGRWFTCHNWFDPRPIPTGEPVHLRAVDGGPSAFWAVETPEGPIVLHWDDAPNTHDRT